MITTHVLDTARGKPASGVPVRLEFATAEPAGTGASWQLLGSGVTDGDGRLRTLTPAGPVAPGRYRIAFEVAGYFAAHDVESFFPLVEILIAKDCRGLGEGGFDGVRTGHQASAAGATPPDRAVRDPEDSSYRVPGPVPHRHWCCG